GGARPEPCTLASLYPVACGVSHRRKDRAVEVDAETVDLVRVEVLDRAPARSPGGTAQIEDRPIESEITHCTDEPSAVVLLDREDVTPDSPGVREIAPLDGIPHAHGVRRDDVQ